MQQIKAVCFSGHRENRLPKGVELVQLERSIYDAVANAYADGYTTFIHGACHGFDIIAAMQVIRFRNDIGASIILEAAIPYASQSHGTTPEQRADYEFVMNNTQSKVVLSQTYSKEVFFVRNRWMCDNSSRLICYCKELGHSGTGYTVRYAQSKGLEIVNLYK